MRLEYRLATDEDLPGIEALWEEQGEWGGAAMFRQVREWIMKIPTGEPWGVVAQDAATGAIVGQLQMLPTAVQLDGQLVPAVRPYATIVSRATSGRILSMNPLDQPAIALYQRGIALAREGGAHLSHMVADPNWLPLLRLYPPLAVETFPLWSRSLPLDRPPGLPPGFEEVPVEGVDPRVDALGAAWTELHGCGTVRSAAGLHWKTRREEHSVLGVERNGRLTGVVASLPRGDRQWLITDLYAADPGESLKATLVAACRVAHDLALQDPEKLRKIGILATPPMLPTLAELGFSRDNYQFPLVVQRLDASLTKAAIAPQRWYVAATD